MGRLRGRCPRARTTPCLLRGDRSAPSHPSLSCLLFGWRQMKSKCRPGRGAGRMAWHQCHRCTPHQGSSSGALRTACSCSPAARSLKNFPNVPLTGTFAASSRAGGRGRGRTHISWSMEEARGQWGSSRPAGWGGMRRCQLRAPQFTQEPLQIGTCCEGGFLCLYSHC